MLPDDALLDPVDLNAVALADPVDPFDDDALEQLALDHDLMPEDLA